MTESLPAGTTLGDFEIVRELGRGGMGIVYEALQLSDRRSVALKVLPSSMGISATARQRFRREAQAAARLQHDHIVAVYAEGEDNGTCFFAMELVEGRTLGELIAGERFVAPTVVAGSTDGENAAAETQTSSVSATKPARGAGELTRQKVDEIVGWIADVADALQYAHQNGVVHRDIKPSNLMVDGGGRVRLMDFGLARVQEEPGMTVSGQMLGTPRYMSPEQITAGRMKVDHRTDVYSLGATLYELLTLNPPFPGDSRDQIITQIISKEPRSLRQLDNRIPLDLDTVCLKAIEKDPDRRYQTAGEMARDLRRFLNNHAIAAQRVGPAGRLLRWAEQRPAAAALWVLALCGLLAVGYLANRTRELARVRLRQLRETAVTATANGNFAAAEAAIDEAADRGLSEDWMYLLRGQAALRQGSTIEAVRHFRRAQEITPESGAAQAMLHYAYLVSGNQTQYLEGLQQLRTIPLSTFEDFLFAGQAVAYGDPVWGLELLEKASEFRQTPLGYRTSAEIRMRMGWRNADAEQAERAVQEATIAEDMMEDPLEARCIRITAHLSASTVYRHLGREKEAQRHFERAGEIDATLPDGDHGSLPDQFLATGFYLDYGGRDGEAAAFYRAGCSLGSFRGDEACLVCALPPTQFRGGRRCARALRRVCDG